MNRVDLIGRITRDLEPRRSASGTTVLRFTVAVDRRFKQPGQPEADFISCVAFGKTADNMARYLHKGSLISVEGRIQTGSYVNQQGQKVYTTDVVADQVSFLETRKQAQAGGNSYGQGGYDNGGYGNNSYGGNQNSYGGGYGQSNPYAQSVPNSFNQPSSMGGSHSDYSGADDSSSIVDDSQTLEIASDDLPF